METGCVIRDIGNPEDLKSEYIYVVCINPRGWIPTFIVNMVAAEQALNCVRVKEHFLEEDNKDTDPKAPPLPKD